jgi:Predicted membrane protein
MTNNSENKLSDLNNTADTTAEFDPKDIEQNKTMSLFAYLNILVLIPLLGAKDSKFARFHSNQGLILLITCIGWAVAYNILMAIFRVIMLPGGWRIYSLLGTILSLVYIVFAVLVIIGIVNALNGKAKELPIIGKYKLLK